MGFSQRLVGLACLILFGLGQSSAAFELFGIHLWGEKKDDGGEIDIIDPLRYTARLKIEGNDPALTKDLSIASTVIRRADQPALGRSGLLASANGDYGRLLDALYANGYYGGSVSILINGTEARALPLDADLGQGVPVLVQVDPGPQFTFGTADIVNPPTTEPMPDAPFASGAPALSGVVGEAAREAVGQWRDRGHAKADIAAVDAVADHAEERLDVTITLAPGRLAKYGTTTVTGTERIDADFVAYMAHLERGRIYDEKDIRAARARLLKMDTFRSVDIKQADAISDDGFLDMTVTVEDRKPRRLGAGVTISNLEGLKLEGFWLHRNLAGRGERFRIDGSVAGIGRSSDPQDYDYEAAATFIRPGTFTPDTDFTLKIGAERERIADYNTLLLTTSAGLSTVFSPNLSGDITLVNERSWTDNALGNRKFSLTGVELGLDYDTRDVPLNATSGVYVSVDLFPFYELNSEKFGLQSTIEARAYRALDADKRFVLAGRALLGAVSGIGLLDTPPQVLFFSGGGGSVRGYNYQSIGVTAPGGETIGGRSIVELSGEMRVGITETFSMVGFLDAGLVGTGTAPDLGQGFKTSIGFGARFNTGLGPIRLDLARGLDRRTGDPEIGLYIGLGQAF